MVITSQEQVLAALGLCQTDCVPVDFYGHRHSGIAAIAYPKLQQNIGLMHLSSWRDKT
jgi:hypothetical protein